MKQLLLVSFFCLFFFGTDAQKDSAKPNITRMSKIELQDSQYLKLYISIQELNSKLKPDVKTFWEKYTAAIVTFIVGLLAVFANIFIHISLKKSNEKTHQVQINNSLEIVKKQIQNSQELANIQYKGELMAKNRQDWSNTVRVQMSEFLTNSSMFSLAVSNKDMANKTIFFQNLKMCISQLQLLLNPNLDLHEEVFSKMEKVTSILRANTFDIESYNNESLELVEACRKLLYN